MDNDNKVSASTEVGHSKVQIFLHDSLNAIRQDQQKTYNLHEEFSKTKRNKDYFVVKVISAVVVLVALVSWGVTSAINQSSRNVKVDIAVFDDINLRNALDMAKKAEDKLVAAEQNKKSIQADLQSDLSALALKKQSEIDIVANQRMTDAARKQKLAELDALYAAKKKSLNASYSAKLASADLAIVNAQKEVSSFDQKRVDEARKQKKMLDNQQDLFELEKKKLTDAYEAELADLRKKVDSIQKENAMLKTAEVKKIMDQYQAKIDGIDPAFGDASADGIVASVSAVEASVPFRSAPAFIPSAFGFGEKDFSSVARSYSDLGFLLGKVSELPFENDVGKYAAAARKLAFIAGSANEKIINAAFTRIGDDEAKLAETRSALEQMTADRDAVSAERDRIVSGRDAAVRAVSAYESALASFALANDYAGFVIAMRPVEPVAPEDAAAQGDDQGVSRTASSASDGSAAPAPAILEPEFYFAGNAIDTAFTAEKPVAVAYLYRAPKTLIATLALSRDEAGSVVAVVEKLEKNKAIQPLDFISVKKR
jgi:hypothetical protein